MFFIFDQDPQNEKLEVIKKKIQEEAKQAREKRAAEADASESSSDEEASAKKEKAKQSSEKNQPWKDKPDSVNHYNLKEQVAKAKGLEATNNGDWQSPEELTDGDVERPEPYTSMGCEFNPEDFLKLKQMIDEEKKLKKD